MSAKTYRTATPTADGKQPEPLLYAAGSHLTPRRVGTERVRAYLVFVAGVAALLGGIYYAADLDQPALGILGGVLFGAAVIYTASVVNDIENVRRQLWAREAATGQDIDGDGYVGKPTRPAGHEVNVAGGAPFVLPDLDPPPDRTPLPGFPVPANDVIYILDRARQTPLTVRNWEKQRLPSGETVDRDLLTAILDGMIHWRFAVASYTADGRRLVDLRSDLDVDAMIHAVNQAIRDNARQPQK